MSEERLVRFVGLDPERLQRLEDLAFAADRLEKLERQQERLIARYTQLEEEHTELTRRLIVFETWAQAPDQPLPATGTRLRELEIKVDLALRRQKGDDGPPGPRGFPGQDGAPGPPGKDGATVIREVKISG